MPGVKFKSIFKGKEIAFKFDAMVDVDALLLSTLIDYGIFTRSQSHAIKVRNVYLFIYYKNRTRSTNIKNEIKHLTHHTASTQFCDMIY